VEAMNFLTTLLLLPFLLFGSNVESIFHLTTGEANDSCLFISQSDEKYDGFFSGGPQSFRVGMDGFFYVADTLKKRIIRYDVMGKMAGQIPESGQFDYLPMDFVIDENSLLTLYNTKLGQLEKWSATGKLRDTVTVTTVGKKPGFITWMERDKDSNIYLKDSQKQAVVILNPMGKPLGGLRTTAPSFAIDEIGNIFYLENSGDGHVLYSYTRGSKPFRLFNVGFREYPEGRVVGIDGSGRLFLLLEHNQRSLLLVVDSAGMIDLEKNIPYINMSRRLFVTAAGQIYYTIFDPDFEKGAFRIFRFK
jgi:hypothetical protein